MYKPSGKGVKKMYNLKQTPNYEANVRQTFVKFNSCDKFMVKCWNLIK